MMAKGHFISGVAAGLLTSPLAVELAPVGIGGPARVLALAGVWSFVSGVGALWPDIDHKPAVISKLLWITGIGWLMRVASRFTYQATRTERDKPTGCHRTLTHTIPFVALTGAGVGALLLISPSTAPWAWFFGVALAIGTLMHIFGDALTLTGVPLYWPLLDHHGRRWGTRGVPRWMRFRAGGKYGEPAATFAFTGLAMAVGALVLVADGAPWWVPVMTLLEGR